MGKVFLVKGKDGSIRVFYSEEKMRAAGFAKADRAVGEEEFNGSGGYARLVDGAIVVGRTAGEMAEAGRLARLGEIDAELDGIDRKSGRPARAVAVAMAKGGAAEPQDVARLDEFEVLAATLRTERSAILAAGVAG